MSSVTDPTKAQQKNAIKVAALYKFVTLDDFKALRDPIRKLCQNQSIQGTILLATEGINGTVAGSPNAIGNLITFLKTAEIFAGRFNDLDVKYSYANTPPFHRLRVRLKPEIVTLRAEEAAPDKQVGTYVEPEDWNNVISAPGTIVIDTRNDYEVEIGTFEGAIDPHTASFTEFKTYVKEHLDPERDKRIAMFCTGGIRCEKASSYLLAHGFDEVYHLKGGILKYLEDVPEEKSLWRGQCFVFDERVGVGHGLAEGDYSLCRACRRPISPEDRTHKDFVEGIQCAKCKDERTDKERARARARQQQMEIAKKRGFIHMGDQATKDAERLKLEKARERERSKEAHNRSATANKS